MRKINKFVFGMILVICIFAQYLVKYKMHYVLLLIIIAYGARIMLINTSRTRIYKYQYAVYKSTKFVCMYLALLSIVYLMQAQHIGLSKVRDVFAQLNYMILYQLTFILLANIILENSCNDRSIWKIIIGYTYIYYVWYNIQYLIQYRSIPHNAYIACLGLILLSNALDKVIYHRQRIINRTITILQIIVLIIMPVMAYLRGATLTLLIIIATQIAFLIRYKRKNRERSIASLIVVIALSIVIFSSESYTYQFREMNTYGYSRPQEMLSAYYSEDESNRDVRIAWWDGILSTASSSPIWGTAYLFEFQPFGTYYSNASMLHNYYASMIVDTGIIVFMIYIGIMIGAIKSALRKIRKGETRYIKYILWNIALVSTYATNAYGHVWHIAAPMAILQSYSLAEMYKPGINTTSRTVGEDQSLAVSA